MVEIGEGELLFRREELDVTLLVDSEHLAAVYSRAAPGWGRTPLHVHARHAEVVFVLEGELALRLEDRVHRLDSETWAFVPPGVVHTFEVTGGVGSTEPPESGGAGFAGAGAGSDEQARFLVLHAPGSGYGDYVRGSGAPFDQQPPPEYATGDPGLVIVRRTGGKDGETIADVAERRSTILVDADELTLCEFMRGAGVRGATRHVHHHHADAFFVLEGELTFLLAEGSLRAPAGTLAVYPPGVVHGFDNDAAESALFYNLHLPASGFADYLRGRNPSFDQHDPPADGGVDPAAAVVTRLSG
jgi:quercetin dioxygenase-like cupin family protein